MSNSLAARAAQLLADFEATRPASDTPADRSEVRAVARPAARSGVRAAVQPAPVPAAPVRHLHAVVHETEDAAPIDAVAVRSDAPIASVSRIGKVLNERRKTERAMASEDLGRAITDADMSNAAVARPLDVDESVIRAFRDPSRDKAHADGDVGAMPVEVQERYYLLRLARARGRRRAMQPARPAMDLALDVVEAGAALPRALRMADVTERREALRALAQKLVMLALDLLDSTEAM